MAILISDEIDSRANDIVSNNDGYFMMLMKPIHQESITAQNIYAPNKIASKCVKWKLIEL